MWNLAGCQCNKISLTDSRLNNILNHTVYTYFESYSHFSFSDTEQLVSLSSRAYVGVEDNINYDIVNYTNGMHTGGDAFNCWELVLNLSADVLLVFYFIFSKPSYKNIFFCNK